MKTIMFSAGNVYVPPPCLNDNRSVSVVTNMGILASLRLAKRDGWPKSVTSTETGKIGSRVRTGARGNRRWDPKREQSRN